MLRTEIERMSIIWENYENVCFHPNLNSQWKTYPEDPINEVKQEILSESPQNRVKGWEEKYENFKRNDPMRR